MMKSTRWAFNTKTWLPTAQEWRTCLASIQPEESARISEFMFRKSAKMSMAGRLMLRKWAQTSLNLPWQDISFARTDKGRPYLCGTVENGDVNVSHQGDWVVLVSSPSSNIGVDVMKIEYKGGKSLGEFFRLMTRQFTPTEWCAIRGYESDHQQLTAFYRHWCLKESAVKALGVGIGFNLQKISFDLKTPFLKVDEITSDTTVCIESSNDCWLFEESKLDDDHIVAVAIKDAETSQDIPFKRKSLSELLDGSIPFHDVSDANVSEFFNKEEGHWL